MKILVVDDKKANLEAATKFFETIADVEIDTASTANEAIEKLKKEVFEGAIIDMELPRDKDSQAEELGIEIAEIAEKLHIRYTIATGKFDSGHTSNVTLVYTDIDLWRFGKEEEERKNKGCIADVTLYHRMSNHVLKSKDEIPTWEAIWKCLKEQFSNDYLEGFESRRRLGAAKVFELYCE